MEYEQAWLNYYENQNYINKEFFSSIYTNFSGDIQINIVNEFELLTKKVFNKKILISIKKDDSTLLLLKTDDIDLGSEGYRIKANGKQIVIEGNTPNGLIYGAFRLIREVTLNNCIDALDLCSIPSNPVRMLNHWDNMSGDIERGYSGQSFFFKDGEIILDERIKDYARLISSIGINAVTMNNVNVYDAQKLITEDSLVKLKIISDIFNGYGIKLFISVSFSSPIEVGGLNTADPLENSVIEWWGNRASIIYNIIPNLGGFLVKADSEGRPGPFTYNRNHAEGANLLANAIKKYNGILIWRCFVYNCQQDWRDKKTDRARSGYDNFMPLDGKFNDNVILQIKNGPMDFQVREPVSPLFGGLRKTNQLLEVQIAQEYTGQQKHICYLIPMFKKILEFKTYCSKENDSVADIISGKTFNTTNTGIVAVTNTGNDENWTGHDFAAANLYGFGRLAWDTNLSSEEISVEWIKQTFSSNNLVVSTINKILLTSWETYEKYNAPLGIGWMVNQNHHFGPNVDGYEFDRWGTYHRADHKGIGVDRTENGTGFVNQYNKENAQLYSNLKTCPDELILFFHHLNYDYVLDSGKTIIQHIYDTHFEGVEDVEQFKKLWISLKGLIDNKRYDRILKRVDFQIEHAKEWRDVVNTYFYRKSFIPDERSRLIY